MLELILLLSTEVGVMSVSLSHCMLMHVAIVHVRDLAHSQAVEYLHYLGDQQLMVVCYPNLLLASTLTSLASLRISHRSTVMNK